MQLTAGCLTGCSTAIAVAAALLSGCSATDGLMSEVTLPAEEAKVDAAGGRAAVEPATPGSNIRAEPSDTTLTLAPHERAFLDALVAGGLRPSSELLALRIGSYVCQARAARQPPQAVWDFVEPLVSTDVHEAHILPPTDTDIHAATYNYIRIATKRLC